ncbi:MAG: YlmC/YmxH family sporulation protein [Oscillospiraceae bacterium]|nr:YlmC/YmxH family sporulation protein [Oscillospiraceae bacterium]
MTCRIEDLKHKDVISIKDGTRYGTVCDVVIDTSTARLCAIVIFGRPRLFGLFGREEDCVIEWEEIVIIGHDTILVDCEHKKPFAKKRYGFLDNMFGYN